MTRIIADISVSLDGLVTEPGPGDRRVLRERTARSGAVVLGRRLFDPDLRRLPVIR